MGRPLACCIRAVVAVGTIAGSADLAMVKGGWDPTGCGMAFVALQSRDGNMLGGRALGIGSVVAGGAIIGSTHLAMIERSRKPGRRHVTHFALRTGLYMLRRLVGRIGTGMAFITTPCRRRDE